jgi:hypothetical protein
MQKACYDSQFSKRADIEPDQQEEIHIDEIFDELRGLTITSEATYKESYLNERVGVIVGCLGEDLAHEQMRSRGL